MSLHSQNSGKSPELAAMYSQRGRQLDGSLNRQELLAANLRSKITLLKIIYEYSQKVQQAVDAKTATALVQEGSKKLQQLLGIQVDFQNEVSPDVLRARPSLFMANHQGGGLDTFLLPGILPVEFAWVLKNDLLKIPVFSEILLKCEPVVVNRQRPNLRQNGREIAEKLRAGRSVLFFFEGTRSPDGSVARSDLARTLVKAIEHAKPGPYNCLGVMVDMFAALPEPLEKNPLAPFRPHDTLSVQLFDAQDLSLEDDPHYHYNPSTLAGNLRARLRHCLMQKLSPPSAEALSPQ